jgi:hypothetical protein
VQGLCPALAIIALMGPQTPKFPVGKQRDVCASEWNVDMRMLKNYFDKEPRVLYIPTCPRNYCMLNIVLIFVRRGPCPWKKKL